VLGGCDDRVVDGHAGGRPDIDRDRVLVRGRRLLEHLAGDALGLSEGASEVQERLQPRHLGLSVVQRYLRLAELPSELLQLLRAVARAGEATAPVPGV